MLYFMFYCAKFPVYNLNLIFLPPTILGDWGELSKNYLIDCVSMHNLESVVLVVPEKRCLDITDTGTNGKTDGRTDMAKSIVLITLIKNIYTL